MEKLYNNIVLSDDFTAAVSDAEAVPYLQNPPEVIDVTVGRQLFVDDFLIEETDLIPAYHQPVKYEGNPIMKAETPWEIAQAPLACPKSGGVWYDEQEKVFKMWYEAGWLRHSAYAESDDGIHWRRPDLGVVEGTNIILPYEGYDDRRYVGMGEEEVDMTFLRPDSSTVWQDHDAPARERYKLFMRNPGGPFGGLVAVSADGIRFTDFRLTPPVNDRSTMFYNPFRKKWVYSIRDEWDGGKRCRRYRECDDYLAGSSWEEKEALPWMKTDALDAPNPYIGMEPELYNVDAVGYESIMLGMFQIYYGPSNQTCADLGVPKITGLQFMYSRDGYHFSRPHREDAIKASMYKGAWDRGYVQSVGGVTVIHGDELWFYYVAFEGDESHANETMARNGAYCKGATGLAKLRRDGFVSMKGDGTLLTRPLVFEGKASLHINAVGTVQAEILLSDGTLLGTSRAFEGDSCCTRLDFDGLDIATLNGETIRLRFRVNGELYAFGFADANGDFGGAHAAGVVD